MFLLIFWTWSTSSENFVLIHWLENTRPSSFLKTFEKMKMWTKIRLGPLFVTDGFAYCKRRIFQQHMTNGKGVKLALSLGPSINDVAALGGRGYQFFCYNSTYALLLKSMTMGGGGVKNYQKLGKVQFFYTSTSISASIALTSSFI